SFSDLPNYESYEMKGRTYRYFNGEVQYPFGFGLSYTSFNYEWIDQPKAINSSADTLEFALRITNSGKMDGDEVAQVYMEYPSIERMPVKELKAFKRVHIEKGSNAIVHFKVPVSELMKWDLQKGKWVLYPGDYRVTIGSDSRDIKLSAPI